MFATAQKSVNSSVSRFPKDSTLLHATKEFVALRRPGFADVAKYKELFYPLCLNASCTERAKISKLLADYEFTPRQIALFLAMDIIEIAEPILTRSPVLTGRDFVLLSSRNLPKHLLAASKRDDLDSTAVAAMLSSDDVVHKPVLHALITNEKLIGNFEIQAQLRRALVNDAEQNAGEIIEAELPDPTLLDPDNATDLSQALLSLSSVGGKLANDRKSRNDRKRKIDPEIVKSMISNLRLHDRAAFSRQIYTLCRIGQHQTMAAIENLDAGFLSVLLKANGVPSSVAARILLLLIPDLGRNVDVFKRVCAGYSNMSQSESMIYLESRGADFTRTPEPFSNTPGRAGAAQAKLHYQKRQVEMQKLVSGL